MGDKTGISWTRGDDGQPGATWNPIRSVTGKGWHCVKVSAGCDHCYSEKWNEFRGNGRAYMKGADQVRLDIPTLLQPLRWQRARRIFPCSMTDWMLDEVPDLWIRAMLGVTMIAQRHTFQFLTKRAGRQYRFFNQLKSMKRRQAIDYCLGALFEVAPDAAHYSDLVSDEVRAKMANAWIGVSVESSEVLWRAVKLQATPALVRWLSIEPMLGGYVDYRQLLYFPDHLHGRPVPNHIFSWAVFGGESGSGARPFDVNACRQMITDFRLAGVACFLKQVGAQPTNWSGVRFQTTGKGDDPEQWPQELRIQDFPEPVNV